ncbi:unnamed protein product, partial [Allacma fusca]
SSFHTDLSLQAQSKSFPSSPNYFKTDTITMAKILLYTVLLVATAGAISGAATSRKQTTSAQYAEISTILQQLALSLKNTPAVSSNPGIFAAVGDKCESADFNDPGKLLTQCDTLGSHMLCYKDNKCGCFDLARTLTDLGDSLSDEDKETIQELIDAMELLGLTLGSNFDASAKRCALSGNSICLTKDIDLEDVLQPPTPIPGLDELSASLNKMKCATNLECQSMNIPSDPIGVGKCIDPNDDGDDDDRSCVFNFSPSNITEYLDLCDVKNTNQVCYNDNKCGCYDTEKVLTQLNLDADVKAALSASYVALKNEGLTLTTSSDTATNNKCLLIKGSACPREKIDLSKIIEFEGSDEVSDALTNFKCAADLECTAVDRENFPKEIGQCSGALSIVSGMVLMLSSIFISRLAFGL